MLLPKTWRGRAISMAACSKRDEPIVLLVTGPGVNVSWSPQPQVISVEGVPLLGKTALPREVLGVFIDDDAGVVWAICVQCGNKAHTGSVETGGNRIEVKCSVPWHPVPAWSALLQTHRLMS